MTDADRSRRARERLGLQLPVRVRCRETTAVEWEEVTRLADVTPFGARFTVSRPTEEGRLLFLSMPLPRPLRVYDFTEEQYRTYALVRRVRPLTDAGEKGGAGGRFEVGAAFTGKTAPASYERDPSTRYEIAPGASGAWRAESKQTLRRYVPPDTPREETRVRLPVDVTLEVFDAAGAIERREETVTENISRRGAAIFSGLEVERGRFIRIASRTFGVTLVAAVRGRRTGADGIPRLHVEFVGGEFPLEGIG